MDVNSKHREKTGNACFSIAVISSSIRVIRAKNSCLDIRVQKFVFK